MSTPGGLVDKQELIDAQLDTAHLGRVVNSKDASGAPISTSTNRTGGVNKTLDALEQAYVPTLINLPSGQWAAGVTFTARNQFMYYNGTPYKLAATTPIPYVTLGADPTTGGDVENVVSTPLLYVGEELAQELEGYAVRAEDAADTAVNAADVSASNANFKGVWPGDPLAPGYPVSTIPASYFHNGSTWQQLQDIADITLNEPSEGAFWHEINAARPGVSTFHDTRILDMRAKALKSTGWIDGESGGVFATTLAAAAYPTNMSITVADATNFVDGQVICYVDILGAYHSTVVRSIVGNVINLKVAIESECSVGGAVTNFYNNSSHPNVHGYFCITDYGLEDAAAAGKVVLNEFDYLFESGGLVKTLETLNTPSRPPAPYYSCTAGLLQTRDLMNVGTVRISCIIGSDADTTVRLIVDEDGINGTPSRVLDKGVRVFGGSTKIEFDFNSTNNASFNVKVASADAFYCGAIEVRKLESSTKLNNGKHVLFGDSWFDITPGIENRLNAVLPAAGFINLGVGGNTSTQLLARFDQVVAEKPDYVWLMCGTNDNGQYISTETSNHNMKSLIRKIKEIGAVPLVFTPWVGYGLFFKSSADLYWANYLRESDAQLDEVKYNTSYEIDIAAGETKLLMYQAATDRDYYVTSSIQSNFIDIFIDAGFSGVIGLPNTNILTYPVSDLVTDFSQKKLVNSAGSGSFRYISIALRNASTINRKVYGCLEIARYPIAK